MAAEVPVVVVDVERHGRFEARLDGVLVGFAEYVRAESDEGVVIYPHTVVSRAHRGRGVGAALARAALADARSRGLKVRPTCTYMAEWITRHPEYQDLVE